MPLKILRLTILATAVLTAGCITQQISSENDQLKFRYNVYDFSGNAWNKAKKQCAGADKKLVHVQTNCGFLLCESEFNCVDIKK